MLLPSMSNAFEASVLSLSLIVLSVGYSLEWNTDRRLAAGEEKNNKFFPPGFSSEELLIVCKVREGFFGAPEMQMVPRPVVPRIQVTRCKLVFLEISPFALQRDSAAVIRSGYT